MPSFLFITNYNNCTLYYEKSINNINNTALLLIM